MFGKLKCWYHGGHLRGKAIKRTGMGADGQTLHTVYQCPRCHATWTRKVKRIEKAAA